MCAEPYNQQDPIVVVDGYDQAIVIAFDVKDHSLPGNDAGRAELRLELSGILPRRLAGFGIPSIQMLLYASSEPAVHTVVYESVEGRSGNDAHSSDDIMLPIWEQEVPIRVVSSPMSDEATAIDPAVGSAKETLSNSGQP